MQSTISRAAAALAAAALLATPALAGATTAPTKVHHKTVVVKKPVVKKKHHRPGQVGCKAAGDVTGGLLAHAAGCGGGGSVPSTDPTPTIPGVGGSCTAAMLARHRC